MSAHVQHDPHTGPVGLIVETAQGGHVIVAFASQQAAETWREDRQDQVETLGLAPLMSINQYEQHQRQ